MGQVWGRYGSIYGAGVGVAKHPFTWAGQDSESREHRGWLSFSFPSFDSGCCRPWCGAVHIQGGSSLINPPCLGSLSQLLEFWSVLSYISISLCQLVHQCSVFCKLHKSAPGPIVTRSVGLGVLFPETQLLSAMCVCEQRPSGFQEELRTECLQGIYGHRRARVQTAGLPHKVTLETLLSSHHGSTFHLVQAWEILAYKVLTLTPQRSISWPCVTSASAWNDKSLSIVFVAKFCHLPYCAINLKNQSFVLLLLLF